MQRRDAVLRAMRDHPISQRRACVLIGVDPKTVRRKRPPDNPEIREEMHKIAEQRRRFGYRRVGIMLERKGMVMNEKKLYRIYREEGLSVRRRRGRKRARQSDPHASAVAAEPAVVAGLPGRHVRGLPQVPHSGRERRLLPRKPRLDRRHQHLGGQGGAGTGCAGQDLRQAGLCRQ